MSRILSDLLGVNEKLFMMDLKRLEAAGGNPSIDVRLSSEIISRVPMKVREMGLDPKDSTGLEIYHGLMNLVKLHDGFLAKRIGIKNEDDISSRLAKIRDAAFMLDVPKSAWVIKHSVAKRLIKLQPPKQAMKYLGYKSLESMLKREPIAEIYTAILLTETEKWHKSFLASYNSLLPMDFEVRRVEIKVLDAKKWQKASEQFVTRYHHNLLTIREIGAILLLPVPLPTRPGLTIALLAMVLHQLNEIRLYSSFYKLNQMTAEFGSTVAKSLSEDIGNHISLAGQKIHWRVVQRHFGQAKNHPEVMEPHVLAEDLLWRKVEEVLYKIEPALYFWHGLDYVASSENEKPLSFNLMDMAINTLNNLPYDKRIFGHFQDGLWNELYVRYIAEPAFESQVLKQLDQDEINSKLAGMVGVS